MPASSGETSPGPATGSGPATSFFRRPWVLWLLALLLVPVLITAALLSFRTGPIEEDLHRRSMDALASAGITGAKVEFTGRDARISIDADIDIEQVRQIVAGVDGVRTVSLDPAFKTQPEPSTTPTGGLQIAVEPFAVERTGNTVRVQAIVPDESSEQSLLTAAQPQVPAGGELKDEIEIDATVGRPDLQSISALLATLARAKGDVSVRYDGKVVTLTGDVPDQATKATAGRAAAGAVPGAVLANELHAPNVKPPREISVCESPQTWLDRLIAQNPVLFRGGTAQTTADGQLTVIRVAELLRECGSVKVQVNGHTDNLGHPSTSLPLSTDRAVAVKTQLVHLGIAADRITVKGYGHTRPIAANDTQAGRIVNRRADFRVR